MFIIINLFDYNKLCFIQVFAYINESVLYILNNIFCLCNIKTFTSDNIINCVKTKIYMRIKFFIYVKERHIYKGENIIIIYKFDYEYSFNLIVLHIIIINL